ncbi:GDP-6-deoxy-D-mannose reductase [compost metagenome]
MTNAPVLVTGGSGFVGPYLIAALEAANRPVVALGHAPERVAGAPWPPAVSPTWVDVDLRDRSAIDRLIADVQPAEIYHLAGLSSVADSFADPAPTYEVNVMGTLYLLDAVRRFARDSRVLSISSAEVYGGLTSPLTESCPFYPANPYAASKVAAEMIAVEQHRSHGLQVIRARAFNHTGPGQLARFVVASFAKQIAQIEAGRQAPVMGVGNLSARRDFLDVRDVVDAYVALMGHGEAGRAYNVCSGRAVAMQDILDGFLAEAKVTITVEVDPALVRPVDVPELVGSHAALSAATGWAPRIPLRQTLADVLAYWRWKVPYLGDAVTAMA